MTNPEAPSILRRIAAPLVFGATMAAGILTAHSVYEGGEDSHDTVVQQGVECGEVLAQYQDRPQLSYGLPDECDPFADAIPEVHDPITGDSFLVLPGAYALRQYASDKAETDRVREAALSGVGAATIVLGLSGILLTLSETPAPRRSQREQ